MKKYLCLNLKRFDVPAELGGVNRGADPRTWAADIVKQTSNGLKPYADKACFRQYYPEAHLIPALNALEPGSPVTVGCQGVYRADVAQGKNFGAFTTSRPAAAMKALGVKSTIIGHCEERMEKKGVLTAAGATDMTAVHRLLNAEVKCAVAQGLSVLFCIGETMEEKPEWQKVLREQIEVGLDGVDTTNIVLAYEPVWAIGPGKTPPEREAIQETAQFVKQVSNGLPLIYGGGLKQNNAEMLASIPEIDGGLIALTRFSGDIGFYPEEYLDIIRLYLAKA